IAALACPGRPGASFGTQRFRTATNSACTFAVSAPQPSCEPAGWGGSDSSDCCSGLTCTGTNGFGGKIFTSGGGGAQCANDPGVGDNCGDEHVISGGDSSTLYHCNGPGPATVITHCAYGCQDEPPGVNDKCKPPPAVMCVNNPGVGDNCGDQSVISGGVATSLYHCNGAGAATLLEACAHGCLHQPPGINGACNHATCLNNPGWCNNR